MLSVVIITKNEEKMITDCLISVQFADEIIVVDTGSTDQTNDIARQHRAKIVKSKGRDYSQFREDGLQAALGDWLLYVDADERVTPALRKEIQNIITGTQEPYTAYAIPRQNIFLGKPVHYGGWGNDYVIRLFKTVKLTGWHNPLHEQPDFKGDLGKLTHSLTHYSHRDLSSMLDKTLLFTGYEARLRYEAHHPPVTWWRFLRVMFTEFWHRFVRLSAWRDGPEGIIDGIFQIYNTFIIYACLWELQQKHESPGI